MLAYDARKSSVHTEEFDGPLELLLFLVRQEGVDLRALPIAPITTAYLGHVRLMEALDLDLAGEFLVMASTLCWLKSRELLPKPSLLEAEDAEDPEEVRDALIRRLLDYRRYKEAAESLERRAWLGRDVYCAPAMPQPDSDRPLDPGVDSLGLLEVFYGVLRRHAAPPPVHKVEREHYSLEKMAQWLLDKVQAGPRELSDLLRVLDHTQDKVVAFLATLELARLQMLDVRQQRHLGPIVLHPTRARHELDLSALSGTAS